MELKYRMNGERERKSVFVCTNKRRNHPKILTNRKQVNIHTIQCLLHGDRDRNRDK